MKKNLLVLSVLLLTKTICLSQSWTNLGVGLKGQVNAMAEYNGTLYAGGSFLMDGSATAMAHVAKWNGTSWSAVGNGLNGDVKALAVYHGALYAAGSFTGTDVGGTTLNYFASWNNTAWSMPDSGLNNFANCLFEFNNDLYIGGAFTIAGGSATVNRVAKWNSSNATLSQVGPGIPGGIVNTISAYNNELVAGGTFSGYVSKFDGSTWSTVGNINGNVNCLAAWAPNGATSGPYYYLYAGGEMTSPSAGMVRWDGSSWQSAVQSFNSVGKPKVFLPTYLFLYAGGGFNITVSIPSPHPVVSVAKFNNSFWDSVGTGMDGDVLAFAAHNGFLHAGGSFQHADGTAALNIARRTVTVGVAELDGNVVSNEFFPNPMVKEATLRIETKIFLNQPVLKVADVTGKEINPVVEVLSFNKLNHEIEYRIERSGLPAGVYFYRMNDDRKSIASGRFVIE